MKLVLLVLLSAMLSGCAMIAPPWDEEAAADLGELFSVRQAPLSGYFISLNTQCVIRPFYRSGRKEQMRSKAKFLCTSPESCSIYAKGPAMDPPPAVQGPPSPAPPSRMRAKVSLASADKQGR
jgi:hypothetical protein